MIDYISLVPDGEPTLDINLGRLIRKLKALGYKTAVITNSSLIGQAGVRSDLAAADWVSLKIDSLDEKTWRRTDCAHKALVLDEILEGIRAFADIYRGFLATETMLVRGVNDSEKGLEEVAGFISGLDVERAYISIPTRPPANKDVEKPGEDVLVRAWQLFEQAGIRAEHLIGYEGSAFSFTGDFEADFLGITAVHPMRADAVETFLANLGRSWADIEQLLKRNLVVKNSYGGWDFYSRKLP